MRLSIAARALGVAAAVLVATAACQRSPEPAGTTAPASAPPRFVGLARCASCHPREVEAYRGSDHARAMQPANAETVLGDFGNARFTHRGVTSSFFRRDGKFLVRT